MMQGPFPTSMATRLPDGSIDVRPGTPTRGVKGALDPPGALSAGHLQYGGFDGGGLRLPDEERRKGRRGREEPANLTSGWRKSWAIT